jgi:hypothetical protein
MLTASNPCLPGPVQLHDLATIIALLASTTLLPEDISLTGAFELAAAAQGLIMISPLLVVLTPVVVPTVVLSLMRTTAGYSKIIVISL